MLDLCSCHSLALDACLLYGSSNNESSTHIPSFSPVSQVMMIYPPIPTNMLTRPHHHILSRRHVDHRRHIGIRIWNP